MESPEEVRMGLALMMVPHILKEDPNKLYKLSTDVSF